MRHRSLRANFQPSCLPLSFFYRTSCALLAVYRQSAPPPSKKVAVSAKPSDKAHLRQVQRQTKPHACSRRNETVATRRDCATSYKSNSYRFRSWPISPACCPLLLLLVCATTIQSDAIVGRAREGSRQAAARCPHLFLQLMDKDRGEQQLFGQNWRPRLLLGADCGRKAKASQREVQPVTKLNSVRTRLSRSARAFAPTKAILANSRPKCPFASGPLCAGSSWSSSSR